MAFSIEKSATIVEEAKGLLVVGFIREAHYPKWQLNIVLVKKPNKN